MFGGVAAEAENSILYELTDRLYRAKGVEEVLEAGLDAIEALLGCSRASILLRDEQGVMRFRAWRNLSPAYRAAVDGHSPWPPGAQDAEPIFVADIRATDEPDWLKQAVLAEGIVALCFIPLVADGSVVGKFMTYYPGVHEFDESERRAAILIARQVGFGVARWRADAAQLAHERDLRASEERFRAMSEGAPIMIWISDRTGRCVHLNRRLRAFWGVEEGDLDGFDWRDTLLPEDVEPVTSRMIEAIQTRTDVTVRGRYRRADGSYRVLETLARPNFLSTGEFDGMIGVNSDVTDREEADQHKKLLIDELNHRVKNTLAVVHSLAKQTFRNSADPEKVRAFEGRLSALAETHSLLSTEKWESASLEDIARRSLAANGALDSRILVRGPHVRFAPKQAVTTAMVLHELFTNASKYGALRSPLGSINLEWQLQDAEGSQALHLTWQEESPEPIEPPGRKGFGTVMIQQALAAELGAIVDVQYLPAGLKCSITAPWARRSA